MHFAPGLCIALARRIFFGRRAEKIQALLEIEVRSKKNRIEDSYEILRAAPKRPISAQVCDLWTRKSGCAALRMTRVRSLREEVKRASVFTKLNNNVATIGRIAAPNSK